MSLHGQAVQICLLDNSGRHETTVSNVQTFNPGTFFSLDVYQI